MSNNNSFTPGDPIFHPKSGFGTVQGITRRERIRLVQEAAEGNPDPEQTEEYYEISLIQGGRLLVPVSRAQSVGLRHLYYGIESAKAALCSPAESLPDEVGERTALLRTRDQKSEPGVLVHTIRDLLAHGRNCRLSAGEKKWLDKSCQQLSTEVALVDHISLVEAKEAVNGVVRELSLQ